jgi:ethanolamine ammonia-lyase small subunit
MAMADELEPSDPWHALRRLTSARIALGHTGISQPTRAQLDFQLAHAQARDAVHQALDADDVARAIAAAWPEAPPALAAHSAAADRGIYLQRPDLGRRLDAASQAALAALAAPAASDLAFVVADGLSARAIATNAAPFLAALRARLAPPQTWSLAPPVIVRQGRVAIGDEIGALLGAQIVVVLIGERPGLSSPDSMGVYVTWKPRTGLTDESRNCISNVRPGGMTYEEAAHKLHYLLTEARRRGLTGVALKDETVGAPALPGAGRAFLL